MINEARKYGMRGRAALTDKFRYSIENESVTVAGIARRLSEMEGREVSIGAARHRLAAAKKREGAVTWATL